MGNWTIYTAGADLNLLSVILNGVAMICSQTGLIWGVAAAASLWRLVSTTVAGTVQGFDGGAGGIMAKGSMGSLIPMVLALLLTTPNMNCQVTVESTLTGAVTVVDNVPFVIAVIPAAGSELAKDVGQVITTAFQNSNPSYDYLSAGGNGFLDPMKRLLGARTAIQRLNGVDSEIRALVTDCIGSDSGFDFADVNKAVMNAGNSGATTAQSLDISGANPTGIGALLAQAAANQTGVAIDVSDGNAQHILSCQDGATQVQADINAALGTTEFARTIQGAVNGMDQPNATADFGIDRFESEYTALRKWNTVGNSLAQGQQQANAEAINFLFAELVTNELNCLQASSSDKTNCEAAMIQANEIERNNIQSAANEVPMLQYSGSFGTYMLALIIGLGPVIVMCMMFAGVAADKSMKTAVHIVVWPLLVTNVGAELVNAMISVQFSNFMATVAQGGYLSLATMTSVYKELSLQVGTGSHIMASLPVIMSMIFALGETAALVSVAREVQPKGTEAGPALAPSPTASAPLARQGAPMQISQGQGFAGMSALGSLKAVSATSAFGSMTRDASHTVSDAETQQKTLSEGRTLTAQWEQARASHDYSRWGLSRSEGDALGQVYDSAIRSSHTDRQSQSAASARANANNADAGVTGSANASLSVGRGGPSGSIGIGGGAQASTSTASTDTKTGTTDGGRASSAETSAALNRTFNSTQAQNLEHSHGGDLSKDFRHAQSVARSYQELTSKSNSHTDARQEALKSSNSFVAANQQMGVDEIAHQFDAGRDFRRYQLNEGRSFDRDPSTQKYLEQAEEDMKGGVTDSVEGNPEARAAVIRHRAATLQAGDGSADVDGRFRALKFLTGASKAMTHIDFTARQAGELGRQADPIAAPVDRTGVPLGMEGRKVVGSNGPARLTPQPAGGGIASEVEARLATDGAATTAKTTQYLEDADKSGLGQNGPGTVARTASNVANNVKTAVSSTEPSRFVFSPPAPPAEPPSPPTPIPAPVENAFDLTRGTD